mmetsp:Transcript_21470/g.44788  ORF Transcript_21470/g.44788 Transcript_21470/m.44788 type:complete len:115 (-) Transcript_21470:38-382(-)
MNDIYVCASILYLLLLSSTTPSTTPSTTISFCSDQHAMLETVVLSFTYMPLLTIAFYKIALKQTKECKPKQHVPDEIHWNLLKPFETPRSYKIITEYSMCELTNALVSTSHHYT